MTKEELEKLKQTVNYFGHWYDVIGEERVSILEKSIKYIAELEAQIEKMKCCGNCIHCKYDENEESYEFCEKHQQVVNVAIVPCSEWEGR